jgi:hypothetical protein
MDKVHMSTVWFKGSAFKGSKVKKITETSQMRERYTSKVWFKGSAFKGSKVKKITETSQMRERYTSK